MGKRYDKYYKQGMEIAKANNIKKSAQYAQKYAEYRELASLADRKLTNLEKLSTQEGFKNVKRFAYNRAQKDLDKWSDKQGVHRFATESEIPTTMQGLTAKLKDMQQFYESPTSTKSGIKDVYIRTAKTINQKYGRYTDPKTGKVHKVEGWQDLTWEDVTTYYRKERDKQLAKKVGGSATQMMVLGAMKKLQSKDPKKQAENIQDVINGSKMASADEVVNLEVVSLLKEGVKPEDLFK